MANKKYEAKLQEGTWNKSSEDGEKIIALEAEIKKLGNMVSNYSAAKVAAVARARPPQMKGKKPNPAGPK